MRLISFDMPDAVYEFAPWLEAQIVGLHLAELVAELAAIHHVRTLPAVSVADFLGASAFQLILTQGLKPLPTSSLQQLVSHPYYLLELQERIFTDGGPYWRNVPRSDAIQAACKQSLLMLQDKLTLAESLPATDGQNAASEPEMPWASTLEASAWYQRPWPWVLNLATAAAVFIIVYLSFRVPQNDFGKPEASKLVWTSPEDLSKPASAEQYWQRLATVKRWWFSEKPANKVQLALRMGQLSQGCSVLILQEHRHLPPEAGERLRQKCRDWAKELNGYIVELQKGDADFQEIQKKTDALVIRLSDKLESGMKS